MEVKSMTTDWENAVVIDPRELRRLEHENGRLHRRSSWQRICLLVAVALLGTTAGALSVQSARLVEKSQEARHSRKSAVRANLALAALSRSHEQILAATEQAPSVGTKSWGRRFTVTKYIPRDPKYGKDNDGLTATLVKADPDARIIAVDPKLIPYKSWVWIEGLGWFRAEDCGGAIKGFRIDILTATEGDAMEFGKQDRFAIVVPPADHPA
jgi:3D (Asp-Asp-Asp) domain-containing protein